MFSQLATLLATLSSLAPLDLLSMFLLLSYIKHETWPPWISLLSERK